MAQTESDVIALELERVDPHVSTWFDRDSKFYSQVEKKNVETISGRDMRVPCELHPGGSFGQYDSSGGDLGVGTAPQYDKAVINTIDLEIAFQWDARSEWVTDDRRKAVLSSFRDMLAKGMNEFRRNIDSLCMQDGTGTLATVTSVTLNTPVGYDTVVLTTDGFRARLLRYGMQINVWTPGTPWVKKTASPLAITYYDIANSVIQIPTGSVPATGDVLVVKGTTTTPPSSLFGVKYHDSNSSVGTWEGYNRATTPEVRATRVQAVGGLALPYARLALNKIGDRVGEDNMKRVEAWTHPAQLQAYEQLGQQVTVINNGGNDKGLDLYYSDNMKLAGAPAKKSYSWDRTRIDFIDLNNWGRAEMHKAGFYKDKNGRYIFELRGASGGVAAAWLFYIVVSFNLFVLCPTALSYIDSLTIPSGY
jgi:hypothetical protein